MGERNQPYDGIVLSNRNEQHMNSHKCSWVSETYAEQEGPNREWCLRHDCLWRSETGSNDRQWQAASGNGCRCKFFWMREMSFSLNKWKLHGCVCLSEFTKLDTLHSYLEVMLFKKNTKQAVSGVSQWVECCLANWKVAGLIPSLSTCLGCGFSPQSRHVWQATNRCFSFTLIVLYLPLFPSL